MTKYLQDSEGNESSKRLWGSVLLGVGIVFSVILFAYSLLKGAEDSPTALGIINMFLLSGSGLLGIGIFEKGIKREEKK